MTKFSAQRWLALGCGALFAWLAGLSVLRLGAAWLALADTPESTASALKLTPSNADLHRQSAAQWRAAQREDLARTHLETALRLNPGLTSVRLALAQRAEMFDHDPKAAEAILLRAMAFDRQFDPRWTLANFYLRQGDRRQFEYWLEQSAAMAYDGGRPLFALAMRAGLSPEYARDRLARGRPAFDRSLLEYASESAATRWALLAGPRVLASATVDDRDVLLGYCEFLLGEGLVPQAIEVWNRLNKLGMLPYGPLRPGGGFVNPDFRLPLTGRAFDWHRLSAPGVATRTGEGIGFDFSTADVDSCDLLSQVIPVFPGVPRVLEAVSMIEDGMRASGFRLSVSGWPGRKPITSVTLLPGPSPHGDTVRIPVPGKVQALHVLLSYNRPKGAVRFRSRLKLVSIRID